MSNTLVIDTSFGSTVGIVGYEPIIEHDSRTHVERLQHNIDTACQRAGISAHDISDIIVGTGPAPFTGLRAGIVAAKAIQFVTGARLIGQDILSVQTVDPEHSSEHKLAYHPFTLAINDARRKQWYAALYSEDNAQIAMDINYPEIVIEQVNNANTAQNEVTVVAQLQKPLDQENSMLTTLNSSFKVRPSLLTYGAFGLSLYAQYAFTHFDSQAPVEPLYLRRPDVSVPNPLKSVLVKH